MSSSRTTRKNLSQPLVLAVLVLLTAMHARASDCKSEMTQAHLDNRQSGPDWILIDDKIIVPADPRRAEDVRAWFLELQTRDDAANRVERYRIVEFELEQLLELLGDVGHPAPAAGDYSDEPDLVVAPLANLLYGMTVLSNTQSTMAGKRTQRVSGVLTNSYGVRGEWRFDIDLTDSTVSLNIETTEGSIHSFHPPESTLAVLGEVSRCGRE